MRLSEKFKSIIDHTFLKTEQHGFTQDQQKSAVARLAEEAIQFGAYSICVRPELVSFAHDLVKGGPVKLCSVVGFPIGDEYETDHVVAQTALAIDQGADEVDMVLKYKSLKENNLEFIQKDIQKVSNQAKEKVLKVILEVSQLNSEQLVQACQTCLEAFDQSGGRANRFLKTSTGFTGHGATPESVSAMFNQTKGSVGIKVSGGVSNYQQVEQYFKLVGSPTLDGNPDPLKFRIGASGLLTSDKNADY